MATQGLGRTTFRTGSGRRELTEGFLIRVIRVVVVVGAVYFPFRHTISLTWHQIVDGGELSYLAAAPVWCLTIAWGRTRYAAQVDVHDRQTDWIVAVPVALIGTAVLANAQARLGDLGIIWRLDVLALVLWAWACGVLIFGIRRMLATAYAWAFALICWPALFDAVQGVLGAGTGAKAGLELALALVAVAFAEDSSAHRRRALGVAVLAGAPLTFLLAHVSSGATVGLTAVLPACALLAVEPALPSRPTKASLSAAGAGLGGPLKTAAEAGALVTIGVLVSLSISPPATSATAVIASPLYGTPNPGSAWRPTGHHHFNWAPRYFGPGATLTRFVFASRHSDGLEAVVDVLSDARDSDLSGQQLTPFYRDEYGRPVGTVQLTAAIRGALTVSEPIGDLVPAGASWVGVDWVTRDPAHPGLSQQISVFVTQYAGARVPPIIRPGLGTLVLGPISQLIRGNEGGSDPLPALVRTEAVAISRSIVADRR